MTEVPTYRNQSTDLQSKSLDWFLYDRDFPVVFYEWTFLFEKKCYLVLIFVFFIHPEFMTS